MTLSTLCVVQDYALLGGERVVRSVANLTREDGEAFFRQLQRTSVTTHVETFPLEEGERAVRAVRALRDGRVKGAAVLVPRR